jgi:hypothetical protein
MSSNRIAAWNWGTPIAMSVQNAQSCSADITTPTSYKRVGPAASTAMDYRNGYRPGGSTSSSERNSIPESDACTPNNNFVEDEPRLHNPSELKTGLIRVMRLARFLTRCSPSASRRSGCSPRPRPKRWSRPSDGRSKPRCQYALSPLSADEASRASRQPLQWPVPSVANSPSNGQACLHEPVGEPLPARQRHGR